MTFFFHVIIFVISWIHAGLMLYCFIVYSYFNQIDLLYDSYSVECHTILVYKHYLRKNMISVIINDFLCLNILLNIHIGLKGTQTK